MRKHLSEFLDPSQVHEALFVGYLWSNPALYQKYKTYKITNKSFTERD